MRGFLSQDFWGLGLGLFRDDICSGFSGRYKCLLVSLLEGRDSFCLSKLHEWGLKG